MKILPPRTATIQVCFSIYLAVRDISAEPDRSMNVSAFILKICRPWRCRRGGGGKPRELRSDRVWLRLTTVFSVIRSPRRGVRVVRISRPSFPSGVRHVHRRSNVQGRRLVLEPQDPGRRRCGVNWLESLLRSPLDEIGRDGRRSSECRSWACTTCGAVHFRRRPKEAGRSARSLRVDVEDRPSDVSLDQSDLDVLAIGLRGLSPEITGHPHAVYGSLLVICTWFYTTDDRDALQGTPAGDLLERMIDHHTRVRGLSVRPVPRPTNRTSDRWRPRGGGRG